MAFAADQLFIVFVFENGYVNCVGKCKRGEVRESKREGMKGEEEERGALTLTPDQIYVVCLKMIALTD